MRVGMALAVFFIVGTGVARANALSNITLSGSQSLYDTTSEVLSFCPGATGLTYVGTGSAVGERAMIAGGQSVAPMTAFLGSAVCSAPAATQQQAQGLVIGLDGITVLGAPATAGAAACNGATADCDPTTDPTAGVAFDTTITTVSGPYTFNGWRDVLRVLLAGFTHDVVGTGAAQWAARDCNSPTRRALANGYGSFFENNCTAQAGDATGGVCTQIRHIFRRDDFSGATDTLVSLLGLPSIVLPGTSVTVYPKGVQTSVLQQTGADPFCNAVRPAFVFPQSAAGTCTNGTACTLGGAACSDASTCVPAQPQITCLQGADATWDPTQKNLGAGCTKENALYRATMQDNDPIRRACVGSGVGPVGTAAEDNCSHSGDLGLVLPMNEAPENGGPNGTSNADRYNATPCAHGHFTSVQAPEVYDAVTQGRQICQRGLLCPNGDVCNNFGGCLAPSDANGNPQCLAWKLTAPPLTISSVPVPVVNPKGPGIAEGRAYNQHLYLQVGQAGRYQYNGFTTPLFVTGAYYRIHTNHSLVPPSDAGAPPTCQRPDTVDQIGCLVQASPCSIGLGGSATPARTGAAALKVHALDPTPLCIQSLGYPLWNKLYLNSVAGLAQTTGQELALAQCEADPNVMSTSLVDSLLIPLPAGPYCEDFNEQALCGQSSNNNACSALPASFSLQSPPTICGNGILDNYEECDNGPLNVNGGGPGTCSLICRVN